MHNTPGRRTTVGVPESPNYVASSFFNTVHLLSKDLWLEHGGAKLASCPGRHLASVRPWPLTPFSPETTRAKNRTTAHAHNNQIT